MIDAIGGVIANYAVRGISATIDCIVITSSSLCSVFLPDAQNLSPVSLSSAY